MKTKVTQMAKLVTAWIVSLFTAHEVVATWTRTQRYAKVRSFKRGLAIVTMVPLIAGAAFEVLQAVLPTQAAAGAAIVTVLGDVPSTESQGQWQAQKLSLTAPAAVAFNAANFVTFNFRYIRAGGAAVVIGTLATNVAANALAAEVEMNVPITAANNNLQPGDTIDVQMVQSGTGVLVPAGVVAKVELA